MPKEARQYFDRDTVLRKLYEECYSFDDAASPSRVNGLLSEHAAEIQNGAQLEPVLSTLREQSALCALSILGLPNALQNELLVVHEQSDIADISPTYAAYLHLFEKRIKRDPTPKEARLLAELAERRTMYMRMHEHIEGILGN